MASSGVKRVGKGYSSDAGRKQHGKGIVGGHGKGVGAGGSSAQENIAPRTSKEGVQKKYQTAKAVRRKMPPPVSSDMFHTLSAAPSPVEKEADELGIIHTYAGPPLGNRTNLQGNVNGNGQGQGYFKKDTTLVRRALNAFVPGKTVSRRTKVA